MSFDDQPNNGYGDPPKYTWQEFAGFIVALLFSLGFFAFVGLAVFQALRPARPPLPAAAPTVTVTASVPVPGPVTTVTATAEPEPGPRVTVTRTAAPASRSRSSALSSSDEAFLRCVVHRESRGDPTADNPTSSASGLFQFLDGTWRAYARESGIGTAYSRAKYAPSSTQWSLARWVVEHKGRYPWKPTVPGTGC